MKFPIYSLFPSYPFFPSRHSFLIFETIQSLSELLNHTNLCTLTPFGIHRITESLSSLILNLWKQDPDSNRSKVPSFEEYRTKKLPSLHSSSELTTEHSNDSESVEKVLTKLLAMCIEQVNDNIESPKEPSILVNLPTDSSDREMYIQQSRIISELEVDPRSIAIIKSYISKERMIARILVRFLQYLEERKYYEDAYQLAITLLTTNYLESRGYVWIVFCSSYKHFFGNRGMIDLLQTALNSTERDLGRIAFIHSIW